MKERQAWAILGVILVVFGFLTFFISSERVKIEVSPFSMALIVILVSGLLMLGIGFAGFLVERL